MDRKMEMRTKANIIRGLINVLNNDAEYIRADVNDYDMIGLNESIRETKETLQNLMDNVTELEYLLYLTKQTS